MAQRTVAVQLKAEIGQYVAGMSKASAATMRLGESASATGKKSKDSFDLAGKGALLMGGLAVAGLGMAINASMKFEQAMSGIQAATHASAGTMSDLRDAALKAGADTAYSATEAADAITEMAKAGVSAKDIMGGGLKGALSLAAAGQLDVADAAGIASTAMTQFNLSGKDLPHVADLLAAGAGKAMGSVDDLGMALGQAGLVASAAGMNIEETTGTLSAFAAAGLIGADSGTSLKSMLLALEGPSTKASNTMSDLGINMYDSQGKMLDMAGIAGQLKDHLSGLTDEQRNSALATIFGSDAVRAANVLYKEGSSGIQGWIEKVNDAGYAAETAAAMQDNLKGDLEKLGGSWETLMINLGSGAQGPLREVVQAMTGVLNAASGLADVIGAIPGPVLLAVSALVAVAALKGPVTSAFETIALKAMYAGESMGAAGLKGAASGLLGVFGGPWGLAIAGATVGLSLLTDWLGKSGSASVDAAGYQRDLADALEQSGGAIDDNVRAMVAHTAADTQVGKSNLLSVAKQLGIDLPMVTDALLGNKGALEAVTGAANGYIDKSLLAANAGDLGMTRNAENARLFIGALGDLAPSMDATVEKNQDVAAASASSDNAMAAAADSSAQFQTQLEGVATAASDSKKQIDLLKTSLDILTGANITMFQAEEAVSEAMRAATGALKDLSGATLDSEGDFNAQTEAGSKAADTAFAYIDAANQQIATMESMGSTSDEVLAKDSSLRDGFLKTLATMGITGQAAEDLANKYYGLPEQRTTKIIADTKQATDAVAATQSQIDGLHGATVKIVAEYGGGSLALPLTSQRKPGLAGGGYTGPGAKYDVAPYEVHRGEIVWSQSDIAAHGGVGAVESMRQSRPSYADGGIVGGPTVTIDGAGLNAAALASVRALQESSTAGNGSGMSGTWTSIWGIVKAAIPEARINSTYRPGDPGYHGKNKAIDFGFGSGAGGAGSAGLASIARFLYSGYGRSLAEIIYDGIGDNTPDVKNGVDHVYNAQTRDEHRNHVHAAVYHQGTDYVPQTGYAYLEKGEAVIPASVNSREFSGGAGPGGGSRVTVDVSGATVSGRVEFGADGIARIVDGRIEQLVTGVGTSIVNSGAGA